MLVETGCWRRFHMRNYMLISTYTWNWNRAEYSLGRYVIKKLVRIYRGICLQPSRKVMSTFTEGIEGDDNTAASDSEDPSFSSWSRLHLVWVTWFSSNPESNCWNTHYFNLRHDCYIAHHFHFIVHYSSKYSKRFIVKLESVLNQV